MNGKISRAARHSGHFKINHLRRIIKCSNVFHAIKHIWIAVKFIKLTFIAKMFIEQLSDQQQRWGYVEGPSKGPLTHALLIVADL
jgi:hypothetical protein